MSIYAQFYQPPIPAAVITGTTLPVILKSGNLPLNFSGSAYQFYRAFVTRIEGIIDDSLILTGWRGTDEPPVWNRGPWIRSEAGNIPQAWWTWDPTVNKYAPLLHAMAGSSGKIMTLAANPTADRTQSFPNESGTVAYVVDVIVPRATQALYGTAPVINRDISFDFLQQLSGNTSPVVSPMLNGDRVTYVARNNGTQFNVTFPSSIRWPAGGAQPSQPQASGSGQTATGVWVIRRINGLYLGELVGSSGSPPSPTYEPGGSEGVPQEYWFPAPWPIHNL